MIDAYIKLGRADGTQNNRGNRGLINTHEYPCTAGQNAGKPLVDMPTFGTKSTSPSPLTNPENI